MKKILDIDEMPFIKSYQYHAYAFSILGKTTESYHWLCNQYVQLVYRVDNRLEYYTNFITRQDAFYCENINDKLLDTLHIDPLKLIKEAILSDQYIYLCLDEFYIPNRESFGNNHYVHDCLIYGFDDENECFSIIGYDATMHYKKTEVSYKQFIISVPKNIKLLEKSRLYSFSLDIVHIISGLKKYINSLDEEVVGNMNMSKSYFGLDACIKLKNVLCDSIQKEEIIDIVSSNVFLEHKQAMIIRLNYLKEKLNLSSVYIDTFEEIEKHAKKLMLILIKYNIRPNKKYRNSIERIFDTILETEKKVIPEVIKNLEEAKEKQKWISLQE